MPESKVTSPSGEEFLVTHPAGATRDEIISYARRMLAEGKGIEQEKKTPTKPRVPDSTEPKAAVPEESYDVPWEDAARSSYGTYNRERPKVIENYFKLGGLLNEGIIKEDHPSLLEASDKMRKILVLDEYWHEKNKIEKPEWFRRRQARLQQESDLQHSAARPDMSPLAPSYLGYLREKISPIVGPSRRQQEQIDYKKLGKPVEDRKWELNLERGVIPSLLSKSGSGSAGFEPFGGKVLTKFDKGAARNTVLGDSKWAKRGAGVVNAVNSMAESIFSPLGLGTMGAAGLLPQIGKPLHGLFAADMTRAVVEHTPDVYETWKDPEASEQDKFEALAGHVLLAGFAIASAKGTFSDKGFITEAAKSPAKAIKAARELGLYDHFRKMPKRADRGGTLKTGRSEGKVLEKMEGEAQADFYKKVEDQRILEKMEGDVKTPEEALKVEDTTLAEKPPPPDLVMRPDPHLIGADKLAEFRAELEAKGELGKQPEPLPESLPTPELKALPKPDPLESMTVKELRALAAGEGIGLKGKKKKADIIDAINEHREVKGIFEREAEVERAKDQKLSSLIKDALKTKRGKLDPPESVIRQMREERAAEVKARLSELDKALEPTEKPAVPLRERASEAVDLLRREALSKFRPLQKLEEQVLGEGQFKKPAQDVAARFETLAGSSGKAELYTRRFDAAITDKIKGIAKKSDVDVKGVAKDFDKFLFLNRTISRLESNPKTKKVGEWSKGDAQRVLVELEKKVGPEIFKGFRELGVEFQKQADTSLRLQVESGRMSKELYDLIKGETSFYAPFVMDNLIAQKHSGKKPAIDSVRELAKKIEGIESKDFRLKSPTESMRKQLYDSSMLADRNKAMLRLKEVADMDKKGHHIKKLTGKQEAGSGYGEIKILDGGKELRYRVDERVADVIKGLEDSPSLWVDALGWWARPFKMGATTLNIPFQFKNLFTADLPSAALMSRYGVGMGGGNLKFVPRQWHNIKDLGAFLFGDAGYIKSLYSALSQGEGRMAKRFDAQKLYEQALEANVMRSTSHDQIIDRKSSSEYKLPSSNPRVLDTLGKITNMIEESFKIHGIQRALKLHGARNVKELGERNPEAFTEVRRMHGSPDFARFGDSMEQMNILYMFLNARMQGAARTIDRFSASSPEGVAARRNMIAAVGVPTTLLYMWNLSKWEEELKDVPEYDRRNNFIIFLPWKIKRKITGRDQSVRYIESQDYLRIPKREEVKYVANAVENFLDFARHRNPDSLTEIAKEIAEDLAPIDIKGEGWGRLRGVVPSHPLGRTAVELMPERGYDVWRERPILTEAESRREPKDRYDDRTTGLAKYVGRMLDVAPKKIDKFADIMLAGLVKQFRTKGAPEGRPTPLYKPPLKYLTRPFMSAGRKSSDETEELYKEKEGVSERAASESFKVSQAVGDTIKKATGDNNKIDFEKLEEEVNAVVRDGSDNRVPENLTHLYMERIIKAARASGEGEEVAGLGFVRSSDTVMGLPVRVRGEWMKTVLGQKGKNGESVLSDEDKRELLEEWDGDGVFSKEFLEQTDQKYKDYISKEWERLK